MSELSHEKKSVFSKYLTFCKAHRFSPVLVTLALVAICILISASIYFASGTSTQITSTPVDFGLRNIGQMATQVGYYTNVQVISNSREVFGVIIPFTQNNYVFSYDGSIKVGFDFKSIAVDTDDVDHKITVKLPEPIVISNEIDENSLKVYNETENIFTPLKLGDFNTSLSFIKENSLQTAIKNDIYANARVNAELLITGFLAGLVDLEVYKIDFV